MLFYRAQLDGEVTGLVSLWASPVLPSRGLGHSGGWVRVNLRYLRRGGAVRTHRGWFQTDLPVGSRLRVLSHQISGAELLVSFGRALASQGGPERLDDRFSLPFSLQSWGVTAISRVEARLVVACRARSGALLLRGWLHLTVESPAARFCRVVPFCRLVGVAANQGLRWRSYGGVVGLTCRVGPGGAVEGMVRLQVTCLGLPRGTGAAVGRGELGRSRAAGGQTAEVAAVRQVSAQATRMAAEVLLPGQVLLNGWLEVDLAWADTSGRSRWSLHELPFSAVLPLDGVEEGDRLEPVAEIDRFTRVGQGPDERLLVLVALGVTALRVAHLHLEGRWYRVEQVVGQAVSSLNLEQPLFPDTAVDGAGGAAWGTLSADGALRGTTGPIEEGPVIRISHRVAFEPAEGERWAVVESQSLSLPWSGRGTTLATWTGERLVTYERLVPPGSLKAVLGLEVVATRGGWALRSLVRCSQELLVLEVGLRPPEGCAAAEVEPIAVTASGRSVSSDQADEVEVKVVWGRR